MFIFSVDFEKTNSDRKGKVRVVGVRSVCSVFFQNNRCLCCDVCVDEALASLFCIHCIN